MERAFRFSLILAFTLLFANCAKNSSSVAPSGGPYSLSMSFTGMTPHIGQMMELWVVDSTYNSIVKDTVIAAVPADTFTLALGTILVDMRSYRVDFYADLNGNGKYDPPPVDHAWRIPLSDVVADTTIPFVHNTNFTDIAPY